MDPSVILSTGIANGWEEIVGTLGDRRGPFESRLTALLRRLDAAAPAERASVAAAIMELFREVEAAYELLLRLVRHGGALETKGLRAPAGTVAKERYSVVPVMYATDRARLTGEAGVVDYSGERGDLALGLAEVSIPDDHRMGEIERPSLWRLQFREDPTKHIVVLSVTVMPAANFVARARQFVAEGRNSILLFVHGYNVGFKDAIARTAQITFDLHFEGVAALYSWPSEDSAPKYVVDETNIAWSRPRFAQFLSLLQQQVGATTLHIVAHSMGNRLVTEVLATLALQPASVHAALGQVVFAAPDVDTATFKDLAGAFGRKAERFTLYASSRDKALIASKVVHKYPRAGDLGPGLVICEFD